MNEIFQGLIEKVIDFDKTTWFHEAVKTKDAKNYYNIIKSPIDLKNMKMKAKRLEYLNVDKLKDDFTLLSGNAERYNGSHHIIAERAREVKDFALQLIDESEELKLIF
jgi:hypothetical protein